MREAFWQRHTQCRRGDGVGAKAARARQAGHVLAYLQVGHPFAHGLHGTGIFRARHKGQGGFHLVLVLHDQQVGEIQARRLDLDQHLARFGLGGGQLLPGEGVNAGRVLAKPCMHHQSPYSVWRG